MLLRHVSIALSKDGLYTLERWLLGSQKMTFEVVKGMLLGIKERHLFTP